MYEIIFRGKRTDNDEGEFVYGIPVEGEPLSGMGKRTYIITKPGVQWVDGVYMTYDECIEVDLTNFRTVLSPNHRAKNMSITS